MLVYHSSDQLFTNPDVVHSREALDFGKGFYVTKLKEQADKYANRFLRVGSDAYLHILEYTPDSDMRIKIFDSYDEEWLDFVCSCRKGNDLYMAGIYNKEQALQNHAYEKPNHQLCFITQKAIDRCLKFVEHKKYNHG